MIKGSCSHFLLRFIQCGDTYPDIYMDVTRSIVLFSYILFSLLLSQNTGDFLIRANTKKRQKVQESNNYNVVDHAEVSKELSFRSLPG